MIFAEPNLDTQPLPVWRANAGDLAAARAAYQASLDIRVRLAAADPANAQWQSDLTYVERKIRELPDSGAEG